MDTELHWHEGLFLQPHHLQRFQKNVFDRIGGERRLSWAYPYGVIEAQLSRDDLENYRIRFERLSVVMPNGLYLRFPENTELGALDIKETFLSQPHGFTVYLGIPDWFDQRPNTLEGTAHAGERIKLRYRVPEQPEDVSDENTGKNSKPIMVRRYNALFLLEGDDDTDIQKIPLLRVVPDVSREDPVPRPDPEYVYPCLHLGSSPQLRNLVTELNQQVNLVRGQLATVLSRTGFDLRAMKGIQIEQLLRLRSLNRFTARMACLLDVGEGAARIPTLDVYLELRELLGELMALFPDRGHFEALLYNHDDPYPCFRAVTTQIRNYLHGAVEPNYLKVNLEPTGAPGKLRGFLDEGHITRPTAYFLGIATRQEPSSLVSLVEDTEQFKLMPSSYEEVAIRGVVLKEERYPPLELPPETNLYFFRLGTTESRAIWQEILDEREVILHWATTKEIPEFKAALYMTLPPGEKVTEVGRAEDDDLPRVTKKRIEPVEEEDDDDDYDDGPRGDSGSGGGDDDDDDRGPRRRRSFRKRGG